MSGKLRKLHPLYETDVCRAGRRDALASLTALVLALSAVPGAQATCYFDACVSSSVVSLDVGELQRQRSRCPTLHDRKRDLLKVHIAWSGPQSDSKEFDLGLGSAYEAVRIV